MSIKIWQILKHSLGHFIKHNPLISEEWLPMYYYHTCIQYHSIKIFALSLLKDQLFFGWSIFIHSFVKWRWRYAWKKCKVQFLNKFDTTTTSNHFCISILLHNILFIYNQVFDLVCSNHSLFIYTYYTASQNYA